MRIRSVKTPTFFKGVVLGAAIAMVTLAASAAVAGTGVGKVFNLGQSNRANARSQLEGTSPSALLNVTNANKSASSSGVSIDVPASVPPLVVNSATKVTNLNADLIDGRDSSTFQGAVSQSCANGTAISSIAPSGAATCNTSVVLPIDVHLPSGPATSITLPPSSLGMEFFCGTMTNVQFQNPGAAPATISFNFAEGGLGVMSNVGSQDLQGGGGAFGIEVTSSAVGQFIYYDQTTVTTVTLSVVDLGTDGCEYRGTADVALRH